MLHGVPLARHTLTLAMYEHALSPKPFIACFMTCVDRPYWLSVRCHCQALDTTGRIAQT